MKDDAEGEIKWKVNEDLCEKIMEELDLFMPIYEFENQGFQIDSFYKVGMSYSQWLTYPSGIAAIKYRLVSKGYALDIQYDPRLKDWHCKIKDISSLKAYYGSGKTESQAVIQACDSMLNVSTKEELYNADPKCKHVIVSKESGIECKKCHGWFCY